MKIAKKCLFDFILLGVVFAYGVLRTFPVISGREITGFYTVLLTFLLAFALLKFSAVMQIKVLLACSMVGIDYPMMAVPALLCPVLILAWKKSTFKVPAFFALLFLAYAGLVYIPVLAGGNNWLSFPFWMMSFGSGLLIFIYYSQKEFSRDNLREVFSFFISLLFVQLIFVITQIIKHRAFLPGDTGTGTLDDAHKAGFYLMILFIYLTAPIWGNFFTRGRSRPGTTRIVKSFSWAVLVLPFVFLCDAKAVLGVFFASMLIFLSASGAYAVLNGRLVITKHQKPLIAGAVFAVLGLSMLPFLFNVYGRYFSLHGFNYSRVIQRYTSSESHNHKYRLYERVFKDMAANEGLILWIAGVGPGTFNSRASNSRAHDSLYKKYDSVVHRRVPPYSSELTKKYLADLWQKDIAESISWRSSLLSFPFAGVASLKAELGIVGLLIFLSFCVSCGFYVSKKVVLWDEPVMGLILPSWWIFLPAMMLLDNVQEMPQYVAPFYLLSAVCLGLTGGGQRI